MTREQAIKQAQKRWGKNAIARAYDSLSSEDDRTDAFEAVKAARARITAIDNEVNERLKAMDWYQQLQAERKQQREIIGLRSGASVYYKFSVGHSTMGFFHIEGQGDTWEEAFAAADKAINWKGAR